MRLLIEKKIRAGFAVAMAFLLITGVIAWWSARQNAEAFRWVEHTREVIDTFQEVQMDLLATESQSRGFAITGDETFLQSYQSGLTAVQTSFTAAKQLARNNSGQQRRLTALAPLIQEKIVLADATIKLRREGDTAGALTLIRSGQGKQIMAEIRTRISELEHAENQLLQQRTVRAQEWSRTTMTIVGFVSVMAIVFVGVAGILVRRDFEKRRQAEAERDRFFTISIDLLGIAHTNGYFKRVNPAFTETLGWSAEEMLARPFLDFVHPDDRAATLREVEKLASGQPTLHFENRYQCKDGSWKTLAWQVAPQPDGTLYAGGRDVTKLKVVEESLRHSEENLAVTLNSIGDAVLATDAEGRVTRLNPVAENLTGWTQAEAAGRPVAEVFNIINEQTRQPAAIPVEKVLATGVVQGLANHTVIIARDGTERPIADSAAPIRDHAGSVLGVVLVFRDVTEEKRAERAVYDSEQRLRALNEELEKRVEARTIEVRQALATLDATVDGAFIFDPESLRFTHVNKGAERQLGYTREELLAMTPLNIEARLDEVAYRKMINPLIRGEKSILAFESIHRRKDGSKLPVEINLQYITPTGATARFIAIVRDITERKRAEQQSQRSQRLESIGTLAGGVAHDLNNALAPIMMGVELIKEKYPQESEVLQMFEASAKRGANMVRQLLSFARGAEGERVAFQTGRIIRELEDLMRGSFPKSIQLAVKCDPNLPTVVGDATQLHQVLLNLCVNARDAMPHGGTLTLGAHYLELDFTHASAIPEGRPGNYIVLRVNDTGTGIAPEIFDRIFDPFFTTKGPDKGTGLGLSTVMGIVKGHNGFLQVNSQPGQGSTFTVYLPAERAGVDLEATANVPVNFCGRGETILFVDDEVAVRLVAQAVLKRLNFKALTATDGADALIQAAQHRSELRVIITDLHMPHMDGLAFVRALRRMLPDIPVVVASGRMEDDQIGKFKELGVTNFLDKPFTEAQLAAALKIFFQK